MANWTANSGHFGCKLVCEAIRSELSRVEIEIVEIIPSSEDWRDWRHSLDKADLVLINGEGSIHHDRHLLLLDLPSNYPSIICNATLDSITSPGGLGDAISLHVRESLSYNHARSLLGDMYTKLHVTPDAILVSEALLRHGKWSPVTGSGTCSTDSVTFRVGMGAKMASDDYLDKLTSHENVCTGRFHAIMACAALQVPFSAYPSNSHKNEGVMNDMGLSNLYFDDFWQARQSVPELPPDTSEWVDAGRLKIRNFFESLHDAI